MLPDQVSNPEPLTYKSGALPIAATQGISTVDYLLLHNTNLESVFKFQVLTPNEFSDHAALYFSFAQSNHVQKINRQTENTTAGENRIYWDSVKEPDFQQLLVETADRLDSINDINRTINEKVEIFSNYLADNSIKVFGKCTKMQNNSPKYKNIKSSPWFTAECKNARKRLYKSTKCFS